ncbi:MAG: hypothetical protein A2161_10725 [Candidatus Schekmanbacteria bacterium RBG_13_48_7]|uniref:Uncharacterized protein n=1 Tax=Candidatus Schekmanbacteria bacterium RBG_13_48_7 TaxID=1817878 RepID=A0A1F7RVL9_9BACT|nr:MAG: hypothetical protein A2161_10725 [Candidatus Schekmanbacteria bacterium RBG_13_48_7]
MPIKREEDVRYQIPEIRYQIDEGGKTISDIRYQIPEIRYQIDGGGKTISDTRYQKSDIRLMGEERRYQIPEILGGKKYDT